jgi:PKD repeat protein
MRKTLLTNFLPVFKTLRKAIFPVLALFISPALYAQVSYTTDVTTGCNNLMVKFTNNSTVGNAYKWNFGDGTNTIGKNVTHTFLSTGNYNVILSAYDSTGPNTFAFKGSYNMPGSIVVNGTNLYTSTAQACVGEMVNVYLNPQPNSATINFGDGTPSVAASGMISHTYTVAGSYYIMASGTASCGSFNITKTLVVNNSAIPTATFGSNLSPTSSVCPGQGISYYPSNNGAKSYSWNFGDGATSTLQNPSHSFANVGKYVVTLSVTNACGQTNSYKDTSRVSSAGFFPKNMGIYSNSPKPCPGDNIGFYFNYGATSQVWKFGNGDSSTLSNPNYAYKVAGNYTVTVHLFNACGKDTLLSSPVVVGANNYWSGNPMINVNSGPAIYPNSNVSFYTNVSATKYIWNFGDGSPVSSSPNAMHSYVAPGTYSVSAVITNGCNKDTTIKTTISVIANPIGFTVDKMSGCNPLQVTFTNTSTKGNYYQWNFGDGGTSNAKSPVYTYTRTGQYNPQLSVYDTTGKGMAFLGNAYLNGSIMVNGGNLSASTDTACVKELVSFYIYPNPNSVSWNFGDGSPVSTLMNPSHAYTTVGTYTITGTAAVGSCPSAPLTRKIFVSNTAKPSAQFYFNRSSCPNEPVNFNPQNFKATTYAWNFGDGSAISNSNTGQHVYSKTGKFPVTLTVTNACGNSGFYRDTINIVPNMPFSSVSIMTSKSTACPGDNITFQYNNTAYTQLWKFGNGDTSTSVSPSYAYSKVGTYTVSLVLTNGCGNSTTVTTTITIGGTLPYGPGAAMQINSSPVCPNGVVGFNSSPAKYYLWNFGDLSSSSQSNPYHVFTKVGTYTVTLKLTNGCGKDTTISSKVIVDNTLVPTLTKNNWGAAATSGCPNDSLLFYTYGGASYLFSFGDGTSTTKTTPFIDTKSGMKFDIVKHAYKNIGNYNVKLTYYNSCGNSATVSVSIGTTQQVSGGIAGGNGSGGFSAQTCQAINFIGFGGSNYKWKFGNGDSLVTTQTNISYAYKVAGNYTVTLIVSNSCGMSATYTKSVVISGMNINLLALTNVTCTGGTNGSVYTSVSGGTAPYTYLWSNGGTNDNVGNLPVGTYTLTVTDNNGCKANGTYTIKQVPTTTYNGIAYMSVNPTPVCPGATVNYYGATASAYSWNFGDATATSSIQNPTHVYKAAGNYTVTLKLSNGCGTDTILTSSVVMDATLVPVLYRPNTTNANFGTTSSNACAKDTVVFYSFGGTNYIWNFGDGSSTTKTSPLYIQSLGGNADIAKHTYTTVGNYIVKLTYFNSCGKSATDSFTVSIGTGQPVQGGIAPSGNAYKACEKITFTAFGGATYKWKFGNGDSIVTNQGSVQYSYLKGGSYQVSVFVTNGCGNTALYTQNVTIQNMAISTSVVNALCNGGAGSISTIISGGVSPFTYSWSNGANTQNVSNLVAGNYSVTATDVNGCKAMASALISQPTPIAVSFSSVAATCGSANGSATASVSGGVKPYTYSWNTNPVVTTNTLTGMKAGIYSVVAMDSNKCSTSASVGINNTVGPVVNTPTGTSETCPGLCNGTATVSASGTGALTYAWNTNPVQTTANATKLCAGSYTVSVTDVNGCVTTSSPVVINSKVMTLSTSSTNENCVKACDGTASVTSSGGVFPYSYSWNTVPAKTSQSVSALCSGSYTVTVKDAAGCSVAANVNIGSPAPLSISLSNTPVSCSGGADGSASAIVNGGVAPYTYSWSPVGGSGAAAFGLKAGVYTLTVSDSKGCSQSATVTITEPAAIKASISVNTPITCSGLCNGSATVSAMGGFGNYSYSWNTNPVQTASTAFGLCAAGSGYSVTVKDGNGCSAIAQIIMTSPTALSLTTSSTPTGCGSSTGTATVNASGGRTPYSYAWNTSVVQKTATATGLASGAYVASVTDSNGCKLTASVGVSNSTGPVVKLVSNFNVSCKGQCNGSAAISATDVNTPLKYSWNTPAADTTLSVKGLCAGNYVVIVTNKVNCITALAVLISEPAAISVSLAESDVLCKGASNGTATATVTGGASPYSYVWSPSGGTAAKASGLSANNYSVAVTDANNCKMTSAAIAVSEPAVLQVSVKGSALVCNGNCNGSATANVTGGTAPYTYSWNTTPVQTSVTATGLCAGTYSVTIKDANGCVVTGTTTIAQPAPIILSTSNTASTCNKANGTASVSISSGGKAPFSYFWNTGAATTNISGLSAGSYMVTVTDSSGCTKMASVGVSSTGGPSITNATATNEKCNKSCDGTLNVVATGNSKLSYSWNTSNANLTASVSGVCAGTYIATVTDSLGCSSTSAAVTVARPALLVASTTQKADTLFANSAASYQWNMNGTAISGATSSFYKMKVQGNYSVTIKDANGCMATSASVSFIVTGINNAPTVNDIFMYPNPTSEEVTVSYTISKASHVELTLTDMYGRLIMVYGEQDLAPGKYTEKMNLSTLNLTSGIYLVQVKINNDLYRNRLSVVK